MGDHPVLWCCALYIFFFFNSNRSELRLSISDLKLNLAITKEIGALGSVTLARQGVVSLSVLLVNNLLFGLGGESAVAVYAIISRLLMFSLFPVLGITQGFIPIAAFNYGANNKKRVEQVIRTAVLYATSFATLVFLMIYVFSNSIGGIFTNEPLVLEKAPAAIRWVFALTPIVGIQLIGAAYYQANRQSTSSSLTHPDSTGVLLHSATLCISKFYGN